MTHVDLIEKLLRYVFVWQIILGLFLRTAQIQPSRARPDQSYDAVEGVRWYSFYKSSKTGV